MPGSAGGFWRFSTRLQTPISLQLYHRLDTLWKPKHCLVFLAWSIHLRLTPRLDDSLTQGNFVSCLTVFLYCEMRSWTQSTPNPPSTTHHLPWTVVGSWCKLWQPTSMSLLSTVSLPALSVLSNDLTPLRSLSDTVPFISFTEDISCWTLETRAVMAVSAP